MPSASTQVEPSTKLPGPLLTKVTRAPWEAAPAAAMMPDNPSPMTSTSHPLALICGHLDSLRHLANRLEDFFAEAKLLGLFASGHPALSPPSVIEIHPEE